MREWLVMRNLLDAGAMVVGKCIVVVFLNLQVTTILGDNHRYIKLVKTSTFQYKV